MFVMALCVHSTIKKYSPIALVLLSASSSYATFIGDTFRIKRASRMIKLRCTNHILGRGTIFPILVAREPIPLSA